jgi:lipid II:glycine glycyltransferase (peptidoglycan interpeptide bridge formation enzyme)
MCAHKDLAVPFTGEAIKRLLTDSHFHLCFLEREGKRLSALLYHQINNRAGLVYAANGEEANRVHAGFQLYKQLLEELQNEGVQCFDMEKMGASTHTTNAVFLFKQGIRGQLLPLCGEWSWYKRPWYGIGIYLIKKYVWKRVQA